MDSCLISTGYQETHAIRALVGFLSLHLGLWNKKGLTLSDLRHKWVELMFAAVGEVMVETLSSHVLDKQS